MSAVALNEGPTPAANAGRLLPGDEVGSLRVVRVIDDRMVLACREGDATGFILAQWPEATDDDRRSLIAPPEAPPHPHWLPITEVVHDDDGAILLVHRAVPGPSLGTFLERVDPTLTQRDGIARQLVAAVEAAHRVDRVVGALDPRAIWLASTGAAVAPHVVGVGLTDVLPDPARYVVDNVGKAFVAPEVRAGGPLSIAADRYALGATLHVLATGLRPDPDKLDPEPLEDLPERMRHTIRACLDPDPVARPLDVLAAWTRGRAMPTHAWGPDQLRRLGRLAPQLTGASIADSGPRQSHREDGPPTPSRLHVLATGLLLGMIAAVSAWCATSS